MSAPDATISLVSPGKHRPSPEVEARLLQDIRDRGGDLFAQQLAQWVGNTAWCADQLVEPSTACQSVAALFWIRLYGTLCDVRKALRRHQALHSDAGVPEDHLLAAAAGALDAITDNLTQEELLYIDYRRQVECHPVQDAYRLQLRNDGHLRDERRSSIAGEVPLDDAYRIARDIERRFNFDAVAVAAFFATRVKAYLDRAVESVHAYCAPDSKG